MSLTSIEPLKQGGALNKIRPPQLMAAHDRHAPDGLAAAHGEEDSFWSEAERDPRP